MDACTYLMLSGTHTPNCQRTMPPPHQLQRTGPTPSSFSALARLRLTVLKSRAFVYSPTPLGRNTQNIAIHSKIIPHDKDRDEAQPPISTRTTEKTRPKCLASLRSSVSAAAGVIAGCPPARSRPSNRPSSKFVIAATRRGDGNLHLATRCITDKTTQLRAGSRSTTMRRRKHSVCTRGRRCTRPRLTS